MNLTVLEIVRECSVEVGRNTSLELSGDQGLIHIKNQKFRCGFFAQLNGFHHDLFLVVLVVLLLHKAFAVLQQIDEFYVNQFARVVIQGTIHDTATRLSGLKTVIRVGLVFFNNVGVDSSFFNCFLNFILQEFELTSQNIPHIINGPRFLND
jgi:hypothetical protein